MGEKITEEQVANLLSILRTDISNDAKVQHINNIKSGIKQNNIPEPAILPLFEAVRASATSQHAAIVSAGFSTLHHLLTRLSRQEPKYLVKEAGRTLPLIVEKMGDQKEKYRQLASACMTTIWKATPMDVERIVKNTGLVGKNPRMKESCLKWVAEMHQENGMPFKSFVPTLMELLEDADGIVRDAARNTVIALFENAPNTAKSDLKKQMKNFNVRPAIVSAIVAHLNPGGPQETAPEPEPVASRPVLTNSVSSMSAIRPTTPSLGETKADAVDPSYVNTRGELDEIFKEMHQWFEGKESEANWFKREQSCTKLRRLLVGNGMSDFHDNFIAGVRALLDGILKAVNSLRTSLCKEGCALVQEVARAAGTAIDPMVEILLQNLIKLCGGTKKIASQLGNVTVDIIVGKATYSTRIMQHIWSACQDKNVQPRTYATGWLKTVLKKELHHKHHVEHSGGLDLIEKCVKKGLSDANPSVRECMRSTYWAFSAIWPNRAEPIMAALDSTQQRLLENAPDNPNSPKKPDVGAGARPGLGFSKSTTGPPKLSLRETMLAQKKAAMANKNLPARPGSAMSSFSPMRTVSGSSTTSSSSHGSEVLPVRGARPEAGPVPHSGLSVAPMRPTKFRQAPRPESRSELNVRPSTAGPYSVRRTGHGVGQIESNTSPSTTARPTKSSRTPSTATTTTTSPRRLVQRPNTSHSNHSHASQSSHASPIRTTRVAASPRASPAKVLAKSKSVAAFPSSSPSRKDEDFTLVVPTLTKSQSQKAIVPVNLESSDEEDVVTPLRPVKVYEDPFSSTDDQTTPRPAVPTPVLSEVAHPEDVSNIIKPDFNLSTTPEAADKITPLISADKSKQNNRLLESGINKIRSQTLDVHGFRKLQILLRAPSPLPAEVFGIILSGLFDYLEAPLQSLTSEKAQDVKAQVLATIKILYKKDSSAFRPHVPKGIESVLICRTAYDARTHIVSGLELLSSELVALAEPSSTITSLTTQLSTTQLSSVEGSRTLSMGLHVLKTLLDVKREFTPTDAQVDKMCELAARCLESSESGVRMDAVSLCVGLHERIGEEAFWRRISSEKGKTVSGDSKSLILYYIVKRQREVVAEGR